MDHHLTFSPDALQTIDDRKQLFTSMRRRDHRVCYDASHHVGSYYQERLGADLTKLFYTDLVFQGLVIEIDNWIKPIRTMKDLEGFCSYTQDRFFVGDTGRDDLQSVTLDDIIHDRNVLWETKCKRKIYEKGELADGLLHTIRHLVERKRHSSVSYTDRWIGGNAKVYPFIRMLIGSTSRSDSRMIFNPGRSRVEFEKDFADVPRHVTVGSKDDHDRVLEADDFMFLFTNGMDRISYVTDGGGYPMAGCKFRESVTVDLRRCEEVFREREMPKW